MGAVRRPLDERFERWIRRYPGGAVRRVPFRLPIVLWRLGLGPLAGRALVVLTVTGRSSGLPRHTPIMAHVVGNRTYVWSPWGGRAQWYRNMLANPIVTLQSRRGSQVMRAVSIEDDDDVLDVISDLRRVDAPFVRLYLDEEGIADTPQDIIRNKQRLHVRRLAPTPEEGPPPLKADLIWLWLLPVALATWYVRRRCHRPPASVSADAGRYDRPSAPRLAVTPHTGTCVPVRRAGCPSGHGSEREEGDAGACCLGVSSVDAGSASCPGSSSGAAGPPPA